jgi:hypothetical protein
MTALRLVNNTGLRWSEIRNQVDSDPSPLPLNHNRHNQQIFYCVMARSVDKESGINYFLAHNGLWYPGSKPPRRRHECLYAEVGLAWDAIVAAKEL